LEWIIVINDQAVGYWGIIELYDKNFTKYSLSF